MRPHPVEVPPGSAADEAVPQCFPGSVEIGIDAESTTTLTGPAASIIVPAGLAVLMIAAAGVGVGLALAATGLVERSWRPSGRCLVAGGEMVATTTSLDVDSSVVAGMHVVRLLIVLVTVPVLLRFVRRFGGPPSTE